VNPLTAGAARLRSAFRPVRRTTLVGPLIDAFLLRAILRRMEGDPFTLTLLGPDEFAPYVRITRGLSDAGIAANLSFDYVVLRQDELGQVEPVLLAAIRASYACTYANRRFALFSRAKPRASQASARAGAVLQRIDALTAHLDDRPAGAVRSLTSDRGILVTTFNRPSALARTLPQLVSLGCLVVVVDDGSPEPAQRANREICREYNVPLLTFPANRGLSAALNAGLAYLLADRRLEWISYFQDDVDVDPQILERLRKVEEPSVRPILTGYDARQHAAEREDLIAGERVKLKRSTPAIHLHASAAYWTSVLPIPTEYLGAPRRRWEASLEDYWIVNNAPRSAGQHGLLIPCLPGLVRTFLWHHADSTWGNPNQPDPPLAGDGAG
jgi:hypothetical protein